MNLIARATRAVLPSVKRARAWKVPQLPSSVQVALKLATAIAPRLPKKDDSLLQVIVKGVAIVDSVRKVIAPEDSALSQFATTHGLVEMNNGPFVNLFFDTAAAEHFKVRTSSLTENIDLYDATSDLGRLVFVRYVQSPAVGHSPVFYHSPGLDFSAVVGKLWSSYGGRLHISIDREPFRHEPKATYQTFHPIPNPLYGHDGARMERLVARHRRYTTDKIHRAYMFYGPPGTGKSSFATEFADRLGSHILKLDAQSLITLNAASVGFLLESLRPDFVIIDDVDKLPFFDAPLPKLLDTVQRFKGEHGHVSVVMTCNDPSAFDPGLLRPGRVDTWEEFTLPGAADRADLLDRYTAGKSVLSRETLSRLVELTDTLSQDYLRDLAEALSYETPEEVCAKAVRMVGLLKLKDGSKAEAAKTSTSVDKADSPPPAPYRFLKVE